MHLYIEPLGEALQIAEQLLPLAQHMIHLPFLQLSQQAGYATHAEQLLMHIPPAFAVTIAELLVL